MALLGVNDSGSSLELLSQSGPRPGKCLLELLFTHYGGPLVDLSSQLFLQEVYLVFYLSLLLVFNKLIVGRPWWGQGVLLQLLQDLSVVLLFGLSPRQDVGHVFLHIATRP
jgi:hypothetical protein